MTPSGGGKLPEPVEESLAAFSDGLGLDIRLGQSDPDGWIRLYPEECECPPEGPVVVRDVTPREGPALELQVRGEADDLDVLAELVRGTIERMFNSSHEIRFFTRELTERYEEINLLYSISETLGSILQLEDAAQAILDEVCDVLGAQRGSLWVLNRYEQRLFLKAAVGMEGFDGPISVDHPDAVTAQVFREGRALIGSRTVAHGEISVLSVPIRYTPPSGEPRTVGVMNLIGRRNDERFSAADQKLLSAIATQVAAALENNRLLRESLAQERMAQEMDLAHHLQMKLLQGATEFDRAEVGARVVPAEQVGGDFYHLFKLPEGRIGIMIGDVSTHGFPAALIMALSLSASSIYAMESDTPSAVLRQLDDALRDELETTEMYLTTFYGIIDPEKKELRYSNAGHPHAFRVGSGDPERLLATDPPVGIAGPESYGETVVPWEPGDLLFLFTDGLSDTLTTEERGSGERAVLETVSEMRDESPAEIVARLFDLAETATPDIPGDDRTAIVLRT